MKRTRSEGATILRLEPDPRRRRTASFRSMMRRCEIKQVVRELERNPEQVDHALVLLQDRRGTRIRVDTAIALAHVMEVHIRTGTIFDAFNAIIKQGPEDSAYDRHVKSTVALYLVSFYMLTHEQARVIELCEHSSRLVRESALGKILFYHSIEGGDISVFVPTLEKAIRDGIEIVHELLLEKYITDINYEGLVMMLQHEDREIRYRTFIKILSAQKRGFNINPVLEELLCIQKEYCCL